VPCESVPMGRDLCVIVGTEGRVRLATVVGDRGRPLKHFSAPVSYYCRQSG
jgi:hypothetical protein